MTTDRPSKDIKDIWSTQATEGFTMSLDEIRARSMKLQHTVRNRNLREYSAAVFVVILFGFYTWIFPNLVMKAGSVLIILGTLIVVWQLHKRGSAQASPLGVSVHEHIAFHRRELIRQRDALRSVPIWYLAPFVPGLVVFLVGLSLQAPSTWLSLLTIGAAAGFCALVFGLVWWLNKWAASQLQKQIDALAGC
jgi:hypothetical protein